jgi:hypothetical protein
VASGLVAGLGPDGLAGLGCETMDLFGAEDAAFFEDPLLFGA